LLGTIVNALAIIGGGLLGLIFRKGIPARYNVTVMQGISLAVILIGLKTALKSDDLLLVIFSLAIGGVAGEAMRIEDHIERLGKWLEERFSRPGSGFSKGFVTASLIYCVGSMAIVGSLESGLSGNHETLFAKSVLDGISSVIFASSFGIGVLLSSASVFLYQGAITLTAGFVKPFLIPPVVDQMSAAGGLLITAVGLNLLQVVRIRVGNMLPAIFVPLAIYALKVAAGG
jgi:uncharacterized protein